MLTKESKLHIKSINQLHQRTHKYYHSLVLILSLCQVEFQQLPNTVACLLLEFQQPIKRIMSLKKKRKRKKQKQTKNNWQIIPFCNKMLLGEKRVENWKMVVYPAFILWCHLQAQNFFNPSDHRSLLPPWSTRGSAATVSKNH